MWFTKKRKKEEEEKQGKIETVSDFQKDIFAIVVNNIVINKLRKIKEQCNIDCRELDKLIEELERENHAIVEKYRREAEEQIAGEKS